MLLLRAFRIYYGWPVRRVAKACGLRQRRLTAIEFGMAIPKVGEVDRLAAYYGVRDPLLLFLETVPDEQGLDGLSEERARETRRRFDDERANARRRRARR